jgi:hypothetical protein
VYLAHWVSNCLGRGPGEVDGGVHDQVVSILHQQIAKVKSRLRWNTLTVNTQRQSRKQKTKRKKDE